MRDMLLLALVALTGCHDRPLDQGPGTQGGPGDATANPNPGTTGGSEPTGAGGDGTSSGTPYHPPGYADGDAHGLETKLGSGEDCRTCHGEDLRGGRDGSCEECHTADWTTDCTYCHGGVETADGAPPRDIDGNTDEALSSFRAHTAHVDGPRHGPMACSQCHVEPTDALSAGHLFDDFTPGVAEVDFTAGISPAATWSNGTCGNLYCHGNGQQPAVAVAHTDPSPACGECHPDANTGDWGSMSGEHDRHLGDGIACAECHGNTVDEAQNIVGATLHVNGVPDVVMPSGITWNGSTCDGDCHGKGHGDEGW